MRGGYGTSDHGTLADRSSAAVAGVPVPPSPARHCHVAGEPSLLVEWRRGERAWEGRVLTLVWMDGTGWVTLERWLPADVIAPAGPPV